MARKTFNIEDFLEKSNTLLGNPSVPQSHKVGVCTMVEYVLMDAGQYGGFQFVGEEDEEYTRCYYRK